MKDKKHIIITIAVAIVVGVGGFFGGVYYQKSKKVVRMGGFGNMTDAQRQQFTNSARKNVANFTGGQIISKDDKSITVKAMDGNSRIIFYSSSTEVNKPISVEASQLNVGDNVIVNGKSNSDGSITATNIQIRSATDLPPQTPFGQQPTTDTTQQTK